MTSISLSSIFSKFLCQVCLFSAIFVRFLPYICLFFFHFCLFSSHRSAIFALCWDWQDSLTEKNWRDLKCRNRTWPEFPFSSVFYKFFCQVCLFSAILFGFCHKFAYFSSIFACFWVIIQQFLPKVKTGRTVWHKRMVQLAWQNRIGEFDPPERIFFWQKGLSFGRTKIVGPS